MTSPLVVAQAVGLTGAAWLSGTIASLSLISIPAVAQSSKEDGLSSAHVVRLWRNNYEKGKALGPPVALGSAACFAFCGWTTRNLQSVPALKNPRLFWVAAALTVGIVPYTFATMLPTNDKLLRLAAKAEKEDLSTTESTETEVLLKRWVLMNGVRSLLPLAGAVVAGVVILT